MTPPSATVVLDHLSFGEAGLAVVRAKRCCRAQNAASSMRSNPDMLKHLLRLCFTLACTSAPFAAAQTSTCPDPGTVELVASAQGWSFVPYPGGYDNPKLKLESIELNPSYVRCKYDVGSRGMVRLQLSKSCVSGAGTWKSKELKSDRALDQMFNFATSCASHSSSSMRLTLSSCGRPPASSACLGPPLT